MTAALTGRVAMVTGARGNLGRALVHSLLGAGARVATIDRAVGAGSAPVAAGDEAFALFADLRDAASTRAAADAAFDHFGRIDILCNIAGGFAMGAAVHETPDTLFREMFDLNAMSVVHTAQAVVPRMVEARAWSIVNVAAASAQHGQAKMAAYIVAKSAVIRLTECMALELAPYGIAVAYVAPTVIDTPQNRAAMPGADPSSWMRVEDIAATILALTLDAFGAPRRAAGVET